MKQYKKVIAAVAAAAILALPLSGCSFNDVMLYLYGGDSFTKEEGEDYQTYDGENGISVTYDANIWNEPSMSQGRQSRNRTRRGMVERIHNSRQPCSADRHWA